MKIYRPAEYKKTKPIYPLGNKPNLKTDGGLYIGAGNMLGASSFWSGLIDDVRIYNRALSAEEIAELAR